MAKPYGLANQNLCYIQMLLNVEKTWRTRLRTFLRMVGEYGPRYLPTWAHSGNLRFSLTYFQKIVFSKLKCICRRQIKYYSKHEICLSWDRKHYGEKTKMSVTIIFFFTHNVLKTLFPDGRQRSQLSGKGLSHTILDKGFACLFGVLRSINSISII